MGTNISRAKPIILPQNCVNIELVERICSEKPLSMIAEPNHINKAILMAKAPKLKSPCEVKKSLTSCPVAKPEPMQKAQYAPAKRMTLSQLIVDEVEDDVCRVDCDIDSPNTVGDRV